MKRTLILAVVFSLSVPAILLASTTVSGSLEILHWTLAGSPYIIGENVTVEEGDTLVVDPGVTVEGLYSTTIWVDGTVIAEGTEDQSILFTAADTNQLWDGFRMNNIYTEGVFKYCTIEYAGSFDHMHGGAMNLHYLSTNYFEHCTFQHNVSDENGSAIYLNKGYAVFDYCTFVDNDAGGSGTVSGDVDGSLTMYKCLVADNIADQAPALILYPGVDYNLDHLTIADNFCRKLWLANTFYVNTSDVEITNSIIATDQEGFLTYDRTGNSNPLLLYCLVYAPYSDQNCESSNVILEDPLFVDAANRDYRLCTDSPAIDAGDPTYALDSDGTVTDLGAFGAGTASFYGPDLYIPEVAVLPADTLYMPVIFNGDVGDNVISVQGILHLPDIVTEIGDIYMVEGSDPAINEWYFEASSEGNSLTFAMAGAQALEGPTPLFEMQLIISDDVAAGDYAVSWDSCVVNDDYHFASIENGAIVVVDDVLGDVSLDTYVSAHDAALLLQFLTYSTELDRPSRILAEVSGNGELSAQDVSLILQKSAGIIDAFPIEAGQSVAGSGQLVALNDELEYDDDYVYMPVDLENVTGLTSVDIHLSYNHSKLELVEVDMDENFMTGIKETGSGISSVYLASSERFEANEMRLATLVFRKVTPDVYGAEISVTEMRINDYVIAAKEADYVLSVGSGTTVLPSNFELVRAYPNPFNATATIQLNVLTESNVQVTVYNSLGQRVAMLYDGHLGIGKHSLSFDANHLASGTYIVRSKVGNVVDVRRITLLR